MTHPAKKGSSLYSKCQDNCKKKNKELDQILSNMRQNKGVPRIITEIWNLDTFPGTR